MGEALKDRYASKEQMEQYFDATGISRQEYEAIKQEAAEAKAKIDARIAARQKVVVRR